MKTLEDGVQEYHNTNHEDSSSGWRRRDGTGEARRQFTADLRCQGVVDMGQERFDVNNLILYIYISRGTCTKPSKGAHHCWLVHGVNWIFRKLPFMELSWEPLALLWCILGSERHRKRMCLTRYTRDYSPNFSVTVLMETVAGSGKREWGPATKHPIQSGCEE